MQHISTEQHWIETPEDSCLLRPDKNDKNINIEICLNIEYLDPA